MNKKQSLAFMLAGLITLSACSPKTDVEKEMDEEVQEEVVVQVIPKVFEPGSHILEYVVDCAYDIYQKNYEGYVSTVEVPEGYSLFDTATTIKNDGYASKSGKILFFFVNDETVEVEGYYDKNGIIVYPNPGTPVDEAVLKRN